MSARKAVICSAIAIGTALATQGCDLSNTCMDRGTTTSYDGTVLYTASIPALGQSGANGTYPVTFAMDDFAPTIGGQTCTESGQEFTVHLAGCNLWMMEASYAFSGAGTRYDPRYTSGASAVVEAGQNCVIDVAGGQATISIEQGELDLGQTSAMLTLSGGVTGWTGVDSPSGYATFTFTSQD